MATEGLIELLAHRHEVSVEITKVSCPVSTTSPEVYRFAINQPRLEDWAPSGVLGGNRSLGMDS